MPSSYPRGYIEIIDITGSSPPPSPPSFSIFFYYSIFNGTVYTILPVPKGRYIDYLLPE
jgi:hypothetical protein